MSSKSLSLIFKSSIFSTISVNYGARHSPSRFTHDRLRSTRHMCQRAQEPQTVDYELNLPNFQIYSSLAKDPPTERKIKVILMEHALARMAGENVPRTLSIIEMDELLQCKTACERLDLLDLYNIHEKRKNLLKLKRSVEGTTDWEKKRILLKYSYTANDHIRYAVNHNCLHDWLDHPVLQQFYNFRLAQAACFGQPLVFDFGYDHFMTRRQCNETAKSIYQAYTENRSSREPFDLHFSNYVPSRPEYSVVNDIEKQLSFHFAPNIMVTTCEKSYSDIFPDKECIYLTPHADQDMQFFDHEAIYIIGAYLTLESSKPLTLIRAKQDGIRTLRIPVQKYSRYYPGHHDQLNFSVMMKVLLEMKFSTFKESMKKFLTNPDEYDMKNEKRNKSEIKYRDRRYKFLMKDYW